MTRSFNQERIDFFCKDRVGYLGFAILASQPLLFSTDLLYKLWLNFRAYQHDDPKQQPSYLVVSDITLSSLCRPIGIDLFCMEEDIRTILMAEITPKTQREVALFVQEYASYYKAKLSQNVYEAHTLWAKSLLEPQKMEEAISSKLRNASNDYEILNYLSLYFNILPTDKNERVVGEKTNITLEVAESENEENVIKVPLPEELRSKVKGKSIEDEVTNSENINDQLNIPTELPEPHERFFLVREDELAELSKFWEDNSIKTVVIEGSGGLGKSTLVYRWLRDMEKNDLRGAEQIIKWTFQHQENSEGSISSDQFMSKYINDLGGNQSGVVFHNPIAKGEYLADLVMKRRTILILDAFDLLQYSPADSDKTGRIKDPAMQRLIIKLTRSSRFNGLCVITTRLSMPDLNNDFRDYARRIVLERLSKEAGAQLLSKLEITGSEEELEDASESFHGNPLALTSLAKILKEHGGNISQRYELDRMFISSGSTMDPVQHVMMWYERWWSQEGKEPSLELMILQMLSLFNEPVDQDYLKVLRGEPVVSGLNDAWEGKTLNDWRRSIDNLRSFDLLADNSENSNKLDTHPLVRSYFGGRLRNQFPQAWQEGHRRLYEEFKLSAPRNPNTLEDLSPLLSAVRHGCYAGLYNETFEQVYWRRIHHEYRHYIGNVLGGWGADLSALSNFFGKLWRFPVESLDENLKAHVLNEAGFNLRSLGRLEDAEEPLGESVKIAASIQDWKMAAIAAGNLGKVYLTLGKIPQAVQSTRNSVDYINKKVLETERSIQTGDSSDDRLEDVFWQTAIYTWLADALHQSGKPEEAEKIFQEAEEIQKRYKPKYHYLYSFEGFRYCDLLLGKAEGIFEGWGMPYSSSDLQVIKDQEALDKLFLQIKDRLGQSLQWEEVKDYKFELALDHLALGRLFLLQYFSVQESDQRTADNHLAKAEEHINKAIKSLRERGQQHYLLRGLIVQATLNRIQKKWSDANMLLQEVKDHAEIDMMELHKADCLLEWVKLNISEYQSQPDNKKLKESRKRIDEATDVINKTQYERRRREVELLNRYIDSIEVAAEERSDIIKEKPLEIEKSDQRIAQRLIEKCFKTQSTFIDLGNCGITDLNDLPDLFECTHLETLVLSNEWNEFEEGKLVRKRSNNKGPANVLSVFPKELGSLFQLKGLRAGGKLGARWQIEDISVLKNLTNLQSLNIEFNHVYDLKPLGALANLRSLNLEANQLSDLNPLVNLTNLQSLNSGGNQVSDLSPLARLTNLQVLNLRHSQVSNLNPFVDLINLQILDLADNPIHDLSHLEEITRLPNLKELYLYGIQDNSLGIPPEQFGSNSLDSCLERLQEYFRQPAPIKTPFRLYISYSNKDRDLQKLLVDNLRMHLHHRGGVEYILWADDAVDTGTDWKKAIDKTIEKSDGALLLVSANYASSSFVNDYELPEFFRNKEEGFLIIPVLLREFSFQHFEDLSALNFFRTFYSEYDLGIQNKKDGLIPFGELGESQNNNQREVNNYCKKLADFIHSMVSDSYDKIDSQNDNTHFVEANKNQEHFYNKNSGIENDTSEVKQSKEDWRRIIVKLIRIRVEDVDTFYQTQFSVATGSVREEQNKLFSKEQIAERFIELASKENHWTPELAKTIFKILTPNDFTFKKILQEQDNINWIVDENTAWHPWELLQDNAKNAMPLSVTAGMIRQLATQDYRSKIKWASKNNALVIADPDLKGFLKQLTGAKKEGNLVSGSLHKNGFETTTIINGQPPEIIQSMFKDDYKIIHFAGHGVFNEKSPESSGIVIGKNTFLSTREIAQMRTVPELVFVNCCHLGKTEGIAEEYYHKRYKLAANIGVQLIENRVKAVVVAGWAIDDAAALSFTEVFYEELFAGYTFWEAVQKAREEVYKIYRYTSTWGAYQCYGDPFYKFKRKLEH